MTIYILSCGECSDWTILGIYSSLAKAEAEKHAYEHPTRHPDWWKEEVPPKTSREANPIEAIELDERQHVDWLNNSFDDNVEDSWNTKERTPKKDGELA